MRNRIVGLGVAWIAAVAACSIDAVTFPPLADGAVSSCGDGVVDPAVEACDDGNTANGDGCDRDCTRGPVYVKASNSGPGDIFGSSVALSADGSTLAVGAYNEASDATGIDGDQTNDRAMNAGAVYVFRRSGATWIQETYIKASNTDAGDNFGFSVALSADGATLAVGAYQEDSAATGVNSSGQANNNAMDAGAVYVFTRSGTTWNQQTALRPSGLEKGDAFGVGVALSGDGATLAVGADLDDGANNGLTNAGAVYVLTRSGTTWSSQPPFRASPPGATDLFGFYVALSDDGLTLAVGAHQEDGANNAIGDAGAVYVFARSGTTWSQEAYVQASNLGETDLFGQRLALSGDGLTLAVGAPQEDSAATSIGGDPSDESATNAGAAYVFRRSGATWSPSAYVKATNTGVGDAFGSGLGLSRDGATLAVGAPREPSAATGVGGAQDDNSVPDAGAVYVFAN